MSMATDEAAMLHRWPSAFLTAADFFRHSLPTAAAIGPEKNRRNFF
jgi:hypothetical protein